jgi:hypothetical protein
MTYNQVNGLSSKKQYGKLLKWAVGNSTSFSLVWRNDFKFKQSAKEIKKKLKPYLERSETTNNWPGTQIFDAPKEKIRFYKTTIDSIELLKDVKSLFKWLAPSYPEDLAFYNKNKPVFGSIAHEKMAFIIGDTKDIKIVLCDLSGVKIISKTKP